MLHEARGEDLIDTWTLLDSDWRLVANKHGATRLGFALLLKFFESEARFPRDREELPRAAVAYVADQVKVPAALLSEYGWSDRAATYHRTQIREAFGFRTLTREDETKLAEWLASEICPVEMSDERVREALLARCRAERIEPPGRPARLIAAARATFEQQFCERTVTRLPPVAIEKLEALVAEDDPAGVDAAAGRGIYAELKADPGQLGLDTLLRELAKLQRIRAIELPDGLFDDASEKLLASWKARAASEYPAWMRAHPPAIRVTLLASLCWVRAAEITDSLVELLIALVHKINAHAERRVEKELVDDLKRVRGKEGILFALAQAAVEHPDETIRRALFPVVAEGTLRNLVSEAQANKNAFDKRVRTVLRASYSNHYRRGLPKLLAALEFRGNNTAHRPVIEALELLARYADQPGQLQHYPAGERIPIDGVVPAPWRRAVVDPGGRVERIPYELCVLNALRDAIRRREVWVVGAGRWRDPEHDLPRDFGENRDVHYAALRQPMDPAAFIEDLKTRLTTALGTLDTALASGTAGVEIRDRRGEPWITVPPIGKLAEPQNLGALKSELQQRWGTVELLDILKETDWLVDFTDEFSSVASREIVPRDLLRRRLLLCLFALGTNMGISCHGRAATHGQMETCASEADDARS